MESGPFWNKFLHKGEACGTFQGTAVTLKRDELDFVEKYKEHTNYYGEETSQEQHLPSMGEKLMRKS
jgi:hypothetical protein